MRYSLSEEAKSDLRRIYRHGLKEFGETQADHYFSDLMERFEMLAQDPYLFPIATEIDENLRKSPCGVDVIYYDVFGDDLTIVRILGRQNHVEQF